MRGGEDLHLSVRSIQTRLVESILLIIGIALGVGATAAGFAMVIRSTQESRELLSSTKYREILVTLREETEEMDLPAMVQNQSEERIFLTSADLAARDVAEDVQYAYIMNRTRFDLGIPDFGRMREAVGGAGPGAVGVRPPAGQGAPDMPAPPPAESGSEAAAAPGAAAGPAEGAPGSRPGEPAEGERPAFNQEEARRAMSGWLDRMQEMSEMDLPEPVLEEIDGYEVSPEFFDAWKLNAASGSLFTLADIEKDASVMILGSEVAKNLYEDGEALGRELIVRMQIYTIVGVLEPTGTTYDEMAFTPVFMPDIQGAIGQLLRRFQSWNTNLYFTVSEASRLEEARSQLESYFEQQYGAGMVNISIPREEAEQASERTSRLVTIILFLALSGLLIAGANVSNILFSRALRKRRSVGIMKALGASIGAVFKVFFLEALFVSLGGAVLGAGLSVALSKLMQTTMDFAVISGFMLAVGVLISWVITKALTILPSIQASRIPAAEAIRYE